MNEEVHGGSVVVQLPDELSRLLSDPRLIGVGGATREMDATRAEFDKKEDIQRLQVKRFDGEEIAREHLLSIVLQKCTVGCENLIRTRKLDDAAIIVDESVQDIAPFDRTLRI